MIAHTGISVTDYKKGKEFYKKALAPLGYKLKYDYSKFKAAGFMQGGQTDFWISESKKASPMHVAFRAKNKKQVRDFYAAALKAGGKDNGAPGYRKEYSPGYYAAFVYDGAKNNIEAVWYDPKPPKK
jgi:predicted lactoylglutathione lyase